MTNAQTAADRAKKAAWISLSCTAFVVVVKLIAGVWTGSVSVLAEGLQSFVDVLIAFGVLQAVRLAALPPDENHPYGHGNAEVLMSAAQMILIMGTAGFIIAKAVQRIQSPQAITVDAGLVAMGLSTVINLAVAAHLARVARETRSTALSGEVLHLRSDAVSSAGVFVGLILVASTGWLILDPLVAILFTLVVVFAAVRQLREVVHQLMEGSASTEEIRQIEAVLEAHRAVRGYHRVRTRKVGASSHVDLHVLLEDELSFVRAHELAEEIEQQLSDALGGAVINVHYEPYRAELEHQRQAHPHAHVQTKEMHPPRVE